MQVTILTKYVGPTDSAGAKITAWGVDHYNCKIGSAKHVPYPYELNQDERHKLAALKVLVYLKKAGKVDAKTDLHHVNNRNGHTGYTYQVR